ncbi:MAG: septum formation protein Maf [Clostridiales bacterium]|nr:septum formation protein Maf [Clostridiales bacterium]
MKFILASASPRRKELLKEIVQDFVVLPANGEEKQTAVSPKKLVKELAEQKANEVFLQGDGDRIVLGADTVVAIGKKILGKPKDEKDAFEMLKKLSCRAHYVYTGVCFRYCVNGIDKSVTGVGVTKVYFNELSDEWIKDYVKSGSPMDKAGAYGIQDGGLVKKIKGSYSNVVGLPIELCKKKYTKILKEIAND